MAYLVAFVGVLALGVVVLILVARRALTPAETYTRRHRGVGGQITFCRHCDAVITQRNWKEHGVNCAKRRAS